MRFMEGIRLSHEATERCGATKKARGAPFPEPSSPHVATTSCYLAVRSWLRTQLHRATDMPLEGCGRRPLRQRICSEIRPLQRNPEQCRTIQMDVALSDWSRREFSAAGFSGNFMQRRVEITLGDGSKHLPISQTVTKCRFPGAKCADLYQAGQQ